MPAETSELMFSLLFIWFLGFRVLWLVHGRHIIGNAKPAEISNREAGRRRPPKDEKDVLYICPFHLLPPKIIVTSFAGKYLYLFTWDI